MPFFDLKIRRPRSSDLGAKSGDSGHRILESKKFLSYFFIFGLHLQAISFWDRKNTDLNLEIEPHGKRILKHLFHVDLFPSHLSSSPFFSFSLLFTGDHSK